MSFFDSDIVTKEIKEIDDLQKKLFRKMSKLPSLEQNELIEYFEDMIDLIEKQKLFYVRLQLSDNKEAAEAKTRIADVACFLGGRPDMNPIALYDDYLKRLREMKENAEKGILDY